MSPNRKTQFVRNPRTDYGLSRSQRFWGLPWKVTCAQKAPPHIKLPGNGRSYVAFTDGFCHVIGHHWRWKSAMWSPTQWVIEAAAGKSVKPICRNESHSTSPRDCGWEKLPELCIDSWMEANAMWGWLQQWKKTGNAGVNPSALGCCTVAGHRCMRNSCRCSCETTVAWVFYVCNLQTGYFFLQLLRESERLTDRKSYMTCTENMYRVNTFLVWVFYGLFFLLGVYEIAIQYFTKNYCRSFF